MFSKPVLLMLLAFPFFYSSLADPTEVDCPDTDLATYLISLIDALYYNGLTISEEFIVHLSETDEGYELLEDFYMNADTWTFLTPTDEAWQTANIWPPFSSMTDHWGADLLALHSLQGEYSPSSVSSQGAEVASTYLEMKDEMNATSSDSQAYQAVVLYQGNNGGLVVDGWWGNATSWNGFVDTSSSSGLGNLKILPVDYVLAFPPSLSEAFDTSGLSNISSAIEVIGMTDQLQQLTDNGFTIFAPIDSIWTDEAKSMMTNDSTAVPLVKNHYTTSYSLFSPMWTSSGSFDLQVDSGEILTIKVGDDGGYSVALGDVEAKIIKSDITLENGIMHVIDAVLLSQDSMSSASVTSSDGIVAIQTGLSSGSSTPGATDSLGSSSAGGNDSAGWASTTTGMDTSKQVVNEQQNSGSGRRRTVGMSLFMGLMLVRGLALLSQL
ncbi:hypothetical protein C351_03411 [Cryptococcus neoformans c8]|nr:hypothetical protein C353_03689 [Cryptococcus neoformans var. grubii AD1-83a]OXG57768.1 hypothetical protein C354_03624 [Cryptococcus neoformans var. grubii MW-RSA1955]OXG62538.1 hypothetical protein C352_03636 [Cryptococcus neoformans var. grubii CHC193]OXG62717.1 hypothetical protein C351_03411 [Cryptococcus neoformans var. grubii c8]OXH09473.1 hypothetical protein C369_03664 [Cryptococcus neoformans var. grubii A5-35-17]OXH11008.1 hypothetical protein C370_03677 [Cryptococcus neoformans 